jgi:hypothetical protein
LLNILVYNFIFVLVYDFFERVPEGVFEELGCGVGFYDCFYERGRD